MHVDNFLLKMRKNLIFTYDKILFSINRKEHGSCCRAQLPKYYLNDRFLRCKSYILCIVYGGKSRVS